MSQPSLFDPPRQAPLLLQGDCLEVLKTLPDASVDAVVTDPPYLIDFMGKGWDSEDGIAGKPEVWRECLRVLKPGGHLLSFGATRTYHRVACAIEDAGFEIRDSIHWMYGSGFPKSLDVSKAMDKAAGAEREVVGPRVTGDGHIQNRTVSQASKGWGAKEPQGIDLVTAPATDLAKKWEGWGTALKPAHEPIVVARKPLAGTVAANVEQYGTGAINIDATRVGDEVRINPPAGNKGGTASLNMGVYGMPQDAQPTTATGRWPPNIVLSHTEDCTKSACDETCAVAELDRQSGMLKSGVPGTRRKEHETGSMSGRLGVMGRQETGYGDSGGASRFFPVFRYQAKPSRSERGVYLTCDCEAGTVPAWVNAVQRQLEKTGVTSPAKVISEETTEEDSDCSIPLCGNEPTDQSRRDGKFITSTKTNSTIDWKTSDSSQQSNTNASTAGASYATAFGSNHAVSAVSESRSIKTTSTSLGKVGRCTGVAVPAMSESLWKGKSCDVCGSAIRGEGHATVKPIALMEWLVTLVTPPSGVVLDPFMGSGTTGIAAVRKGFRFIGIEREEEYLEIAKARIEAA